MNTPEPLKRALDRKRERAGNHEWSSSLIGPITVSKRHTSSPTVFHPETLATAEKKNNPWFDPRWWEVSVCVCVWRGGWGGMGWWQQHMRAALIASRWSPGRQKVRTPSRLAQNRGWVTLASLRPPSNQSDACHNLHQPMTNLFAFRKTKPFGFDSLFQHINQMNWTWRRISGLGTKILTTIY